MSRTTAVLFCVIATSLLVAEKLHAQADSTTATVQVSCGSEPTSTKTPKVAIRWGSPSYDNNDFLNWHVPCNGQLQSQSVRLAHCKSQIEVQTEGGVETHYNLVAKIKALGTQQGDSFLNLDHEGTPVVVLNNPRVSVTRSSGPNQYGEQNFQVAIPNGTAPHVKIQMSAFNPVENGQVALRWGHPDFNNTTDFRAPNPSIWKVKTAKTIASQPFNVLNFDLKEKKSEFEIQTEGARIRATTFRCGLTSELATGKIRTFTSHMQIR